MTSDSFRLSARSPVLVLPTGHPSLQVGLGSIVAADLGDGYAMSGSIELTSCTPVRDRPGTPNSSARWRSSRVSTGSATSAAPRAPSLPWPNRSADASLLRGGPAADSG
jgi:hypothetical protein